MKIKIALILVLLLSGCSLKNAEKLPGFGAPLDSQQSAKIVSQLSRAELASFRSLLRVQQEYDGQKASFRQAVAWKADNYLLLEAFPLNSFFSLNRLVVNPESYSFTDYQSEKTYRGDFKESLLADFFGMDFTITEFAWLLQGQIPPVWKEALSSGEYYYNNRTQQVNLSSLGIYIEINPKNSELVRVIMYDKLRNRVRLIIDYGSFDKLKGFSFPQEIKLLFAERELQILVRQSLNSINKEIPENLFSFQK